MIKKPGRRRGKERIMKRHRLYALAFACALLGLLSGAASALEILPAPVVGVDDNVGTLEQPKRVKQLVIDKPGVYSNILVDGGWGDQILVKIKADNVTLRNCEIRNSRRDGIHVAGSKVFIENCRIHHLLAGTFKKQKDAHGITGRPMDLRIRNCEIYDVSGDGVQFDPARGAWDDVLIERCTIMAKPLTEDAPGFKKGQRPGENAIDTKQRVSNPRSRITIRKCVFVGWQQPGQIQNMAALNLKNHVEARVENCLFADNEICFRLRGPAGDKEGFGGASVSIHNCALYHAKEGVRIENKIENLKINRLGFGEGVVQKYHEVGGGAGAGYSNQNEFTPPPFAVMFMRGSPGASAKWME